MIVHGYRLRRLPAGPGFCKSAVPISDFSGFWGTLGCSCFAFQAAPGRYLEMRRMAEASRVKHGLSSLSVAA